MIIRGIAGFRAKTSYQLLTDLWMWLFGTIVLPGGFRDTVFTDGKLYVPLALIIPPSVVYHFTEEVNPLPTNVTPMRHDLCELSISLWEFIWGV